MRTAILLAYCVVASVGQAQDWALINLAYKYNYSLGGTDTISNQIFVTQSEPLGLDSTRFKLNTVAAECDTCAGPEVFILTEVPQFLQGHINAGTDVWNFRDPGSLVLLPNAELSETWLFDSIANVNATVAVHDTIIMFGIETARKVISLSDGTAIEITADLGMTNWRGEYQLIGISGPDLGRIIPALEAFFPYQPGDILQYEWSFGSCIPCDEQDGIDRYDIQSSEVLDSSITFGVEKAYSTNWSWSANGQNFTTGQYDGSSAEEWIAGSEHLPYFDLIWSYPGQLIYNRGSAVHFGDGPACIAKHGLDEFGRYRISCDTIIGGAQFFGAQATGIEGLLIQNDYTNCSMDAEACSILYTEGIGLSNFRKSGFEYGEHLHLEGSTISGVTTGTVTPVSILLSDGPSVQGEGMTLCPNPTNARIQVNSGKDQWSWFIKDMNGRLVLSGSLAAGRTMIDTQQLATGMYVFHSEGDRSIPAQLFIIAR